MEVILLERVAKLGQMGDVVRVKDGFARNFLLPRGKALRATKENKSRFDTMKVDLEARNLEAKGEAEQVAKKLDGQSFTVLRQAAEGGQLYGSVSPRDLATLVSDKGFAVSRSQIALNTPIKTIGLHKVPVSLHPEVEVTISITVARNADEAQRIARGEDVTVARDQEAEAAAKPWSPPKRSSTRKASRRGARARRNPPQTTPTPRRTRRRRIERLRPYSSKGSSAGFTGAGGFSPARASSDAPRRWRPDGGPLAGAGLRRLGLIGGRRQLLGLLLGLLLSVVGGRIAHHAGGRFCWAPLRRAVHPEARPDSRHGGGLFGPQV